MKRIMLAALLFASVPAVTLAASPKVEVADGNWSYLPPLEQRSSLYLDAGAISRIHEIASDGKCGALVVRRGVLQFETSFAVQFTPDGEASRIVMPRLNCPEVEGILGGILLRMVENGDYQATGANQDNWYRGTLGFTVS